MDKQTELLMNQLMAGLEKAKLAQKKLGTGIQSKQMDQLRDAIITAKQLAGQVRARELKMVKLLEGK